MEQKYDFKQIPSGWRYCFNAQCPMKDQCLRFQTALALPDSYEWGEAVFPGALKNGKCRFFRKDEKVLLATGYILVATALIISIAMARSGSRLASRPTSAPSSAVRVIRKRWFSVRLG